MKKIILPIAVIVTMLFSACSSNEPLVDDTIYKCWNYTYSYMGVSLTDNIWLTAKQFGEFKSYLETAGGSVSYHSTTKTESECQSIYE